MTPPLGSKKKMDNGNNIARIVIGYLTFALAIIGVVTALARAFFYTETEGKLLEQTVKTHIEQQAKTERATKHEIKEIKKQQSVDSRNLWRIGERLKVKDLEDPADEVDDGE